MSERIRIGVLTDLHLSPPGTPDRQWIDTERLSASRSLTAAGLQLLNDHHVDVIAILGDLTDRGSHAEVEFLLDQLAPSPVPILLVPGNHDLNTGPSLLADALADHPEHPATLARPTGVVHHGVRIAGTGLRPTGSGWECAADPLPDPATWTPEHVLVWLTHHPAVSLAATLAAAQLPYAGDLSNRADLLDALNAHAGPVVVLNGHLHVRGSATTGRILQLCHAAAVEHPHEASIVEIEAAATPTVTRRALTIPGAPPPSNHDLRPPLDPEWSAWHLTDDQWEAS